MHACMYVCTYARIYVCICMHVCEHIHTHTHTYMCMYVCMYVNICTCTCVYTYMYMCICVHVYMCMFLYLYMFIFVRIHTYINVHTQRHRHRDFPSNASMTARVLSILKEYQWTKLPSKSTFNGKRTRFVVATKREPTNTSHSRYSTLRIPNKWAGVKNTVSSPSSRPVALRFLLVHCVCFELILIISSFLPPPLPNPLPLPLPLHLRKTLRPWSS